MSIERIVDTEEIVLKEDLIGEVKELLNPAKTALFVIDIQHGYCAPDGSTPTLIGSDTQDIQKMLPRLDRFIGLARTKGMPIVWTRMIEDPELSAENVKRKMKYTDTPALVTPGTESFEYYQITPEKGDKEIIKKNYDAFTEEELEKYLKKEGIETVVMTGAYTDVCVASTMRGAQSRGLDVFIAKDLVGTPDNLRESGEVTLRTADVVFGWVTPSEVIQNVWNTYPDTKEE